MFCYIIQMYGAISLLYMSRYTQNIVNNITYFLQCNLMYYKFFACNGAARRREYIFT